MPKPGTFEITLDSNLEDATLASAAARAFLSRLDLDDHQADMAELCLQEALVNCVCHAYRGESGRLVRLRMELRAAEIAFEVEDQGPGVSQELLEEAIRRASLVDPSNPASISNGGRGMLIISEVMDGWNYFRRGDWNVLRMWKQFDSRSAKTSE